MGVPFVVVVRCYANRDIAKLVKDAGLHIASAPWTPAPSMWQRRSWAEDQRSHFGTTYCLVCTKTLKDLRLAFGVRSRHEETE